MNANTVHIHNEIFFSVKENTIMKIGGQIDVENIIFNEITQVQKDQCYSVLICFLLLW